MLSADYLTVSVARLSAQLVAVESQQAAVVSAAGVASFVEGVPQLATKIAIAARPRIHDLFMSM